MSENVAAEPVAAPAAPAPEAPATGEYGEMSFEDTMRQIASSKAEPEVAPFEMPSEEPESPPEAAEGEEAAAAAPESVEAPEAPEAIEEPPEAPPEESKSLARIMEREAKLQEKQQAYDDSQEVLQELSVKLDTFEAAQSSFQSDPISYIRSLSPDIDLKRLAETAWNESLADKAPAEYLQKKAATRQQSASDVRLAKLEKAEVERQHRHVQESANRELNTYLGELQSFAVSAPAETLPLVSMMQAKNPLLVSQSMENIARGHAQMTKGQVLTPEQVGAELERQLAVYQLQSEPAKAVAPTPEPSASLRNSSTQTNPDRSAPDEMSDEYLEARAMAAARAAVGL